MKTEDNQIGRFFALSVKFKNLSYKFKLPESISRGEISMMKEISITTSEQKTNNIAYIGIASSELSKHLKVSKPSTSRMLRTLETKGYIARVTDYSDRRNIYINLTGKGEDILNKVEVWITTFMTEVIDEVGMEEMEQFLQTFGKLYQIMAVKLE